MGAGARAGDRRVMLLLVVGRDVECYTMRLLMYESECQLCTRVKDSIEGKGPKEGHGRYLGGQSVGIVGVIWAKDEM